MSYCIKTFSPPANLFSLAKPRPTALLGQSSLAVGPARVLPGVLAAPGDGGSSCRRGRRDVSIHVVCCGTGVLQLWYAAGLAVCAAQVGEAGVARWCWMWQVGIRVPIRTQGGSCCRLPGCWRWACLVLAAAGACWRATGALAWRACRAAPWAARWSSQSCLQQHHMTAGLSRVSTAPELVAPASRPETHRPGLNPGPLHMTVGQSMHAGTPLLQPAVALLLHTGRCAASRPVCAPWAWLTMAVPLPSVATCSSSEPRSRWATMPVAQAAARTCTQQAAQGTTHYRDRTRSRMQGMMHCVAGVGHELMG